MQENFITITICKNDDRRHCISLWKEGLQTVTTPNTSFHCKLLCIYDSPHHTRSMFLVGPHVLWGYINSASFHIMPAFPTTWIQTVSTGPVGPSVCTRSDSCHIHEHGMLTLYRSCKFQHVTEFYWNHNSVLRDQASLPGVNASFWSKCLQLNYSQNSENKGL